MTAVRGEWATDKTVYPRRDVSHQVTLFKIRRTFGFILNLYIVFVFLHSFMKLATTLHSRLFRVTVGSAAFDATLICRESESTPFSVMMFVLTTFNIKCFPSAHRHASSLINTLHIASQKF